MTTQLNTELKDLLSTSDRISFENMTQEQFAVKLAAQRLRTTPSSKKRLKRNDGIRARDSTTDAVVYKPTHDQYYRIFINDILSNIRSGGTDYCFKWYQVKELLRFHAKWSKKTRVPVAFISRYLFPTIGERLRKIFYQNSKQELLKYIINTN